MLLAALVEDRTIEARFLPKSRPTCKMVWGPFSISFQREPKFSEERSLFITLIAKSR